MINVTVSHQNMGDGFPCRSVEYCIDMLLICGARIDHRNLATANKIGACAGKSERTGIIRNHPAYQRGQLIAFTVGKLQLFIEVN